MQEGSIVTPKKERVSVINEELLKLGRNDPPLTHGGEYLITDIFKDKDMRGGMGMILEGYRKNIIFNTESFDELLPPFDIDEAVKEVEVAPELLTFEMAVS